MKNKAFLHIIFFCLLIQSINAQDWQWWPLGLTHEKLSGDTLYYNAEMLGEFSLAGNYEEFLTLKQDWSKMVALIKLRI